MRNSAVLRSLPWCSPLNYFLASDFCCRLFQANDPSCFSVAMRDHDVLQTVNSSVPTTSFALNAAILAKGTTLAGAAKLAFLPFVWHLLARHQWLYHVCIKPRVHSIKKCTLPMKKMRETRVAHCRLLKALTSSCGPVDSFSVQHTRACDADHFLAVTPCSVGRPFWRSVNPN